MQSGSPRQEVEGLKYESDFLVADGRKLVVVQLTHLLMIEPVLTGSWSVETPN